MDKTLEIGPFSVRVNSQIPSVLNSIDDLYPRYPRVDPGSFIDFTTRIFKPATLRRWYRPQVLFAHDDHIPFKPLPYEQAFPFFEWGLNWCISNYAHQYLIIHSAIVEKNNVALVLPGMPGSGKSTLAAALTGNGWRLLSDELTLIDLVTLNAIPVPRPISLKNNSIELISKRYSNLFVSSPIHDTTKGTIAHVKVPDESVDLMKKPVRVKFIVLPQYNEKNNWNFSSLSKGQALMQLADLSFNYSVLGSLGFNALCSLVQQCQTYQLHYGGDLNQATDFFNSLVE